MDGSCRKKFISTNASCLEFPQHNLDLSGQCLHSLIYVLKFVSQGLIQKEKVDIDWAKGAPIIMLANNIATQWCPNIIIKEFKKTIHYIYFLFSRHYVHIMLLIWLKTGTAYNGSFLF